LFWDKYTDGSLAFDCNFALDQFFDKWLQIWVVERFALLS